MTKRVLALVLAVLFALSCTMLVACGDTKTEAPANTPSEGGEATPTPSQGETPTPSQGEDPTETPTPEPTPTPESTEPAEKFSTEWLVWLTQEDMGDSGKYPLAFGGGVYKVNYNSETMTSSGWEIWPYDISTKTPGNNAHFHLCLMINASEFDGYTGLGTDDYAYTWKTYYRVNGTDDQYQMVEGNPWGTCPIGDNMIYRFNLMDYGMKLTLAEDGSMNTYHMIFCIFDEAGELVIWRDELIDWTDSADQYYKDAVELNLINKAA
jgi:hypothetical protein